MREEANGTGLVPLIALVFVAGAALLLGVAQDIGFLSEGTEGLFMLLSIMGWVLLLWAVIIAVGYAVVLSRRWLTRRPINRWEAVWGMASLAAAMLVVALFPLWGSGSGYGG